MDSTQNHNFVLGSLFETHNHPLSNIYFIYHSPQTRQHFEQIG